MQKSQENASWFDETYTGNLQLPLIFNYIISKASALSDIVPLALELRDSGAATRFREGCTELDMAGRNGDLRSVGRMIREIDNELQKISTSQNSWPSISVTLSFPPSVSFDVDAIRKLWQGRRFVFLRNVYDGSTDPRSIEEVKSKLPSMKSTSTN